MGWVPEGKLLEARPLHPGVGSPDDGVPVSDLPATSPSPGAERSGDACLAGSCTPFPANPPLALPPLVTLRKPRRKCCCSGVRADEGLGAARLSPDAQPSRPAPTRNYLLAFSRCRWLGRCPGCRARRDSARRPRAAPPALIPRAAGAPRADLGAERQHRAGLGGPWSAGRAPPARRDPAGSGRRAAPPECGGLKPPPASPPGPTRTAGLLPPPRRSRRSRPSAPPAAGLRARAPSPRSGGWAAGGSGEALLYQPGSAPFLQGDSVPALSGAAVCLIYTPLSTRFLFPLPHPSQQVRAKI